LVKALRAAGPITAATGKPALTEPLEYSGSMRVIARYSKSGESLIKAWQKIQPSPICRLAAWLCPNKETCELDYPSDTTGGQPDWAAGDPGHRSASPETGGTGGPEQPTQRNRKRRDSPSNS